MFKRAMNNKQMCTWREEEENGGRKAKTVGEMTKGEIKKEKLCRRGGRKWEGSVLRREMITKRQ